MKLEQTFKAVKEENPYWSDYMCLANIVIKRRYLKTEIGSAFNKLVSKNEYSKRDRDKIVEQLVSLSNCALTKEDKIDEKTPIKMGVYEMEVA